VYGYGVEVYYCGIRVGGGGMGNLEMASLFVKITKFYIDG
jgi:hypothetical protein